MPIRVVSMFGNCAEPIPFGVRLGLLAVRACVDDIHHQCDKRDATEERNVFVQSLPGPASAFVGLGCEPNMKK